MAIWIGQLITNDGILVYPIFRQIDIDPARGWKTIRNSDGRFSGSAVVEGMVISKTTLW